MSMYNDIVCGKKDNERTCLANSATVGCSPGDMVQFSDPVQKQNGMQQTPLSLEVNGTELRHP